VFQFQQIGNQSAVLAWCFDESGPYSVPQWMTAVLLVIICQQVEAKTSPQRDDVCTVLQVCDGKHNTIVQTVHTSETFQTVPYRIGLQDSMEAYIQCSCHIV